MGRCADYSYVCQNLFRGSEDTTHKCLNMPLSFTEAIKYAQTDYIIDLMRHIRQSYVNALHETEYLSVARNSEVEIDPMPSNRELIEWYFKLGNSQFHYATEPRLASYLLRDMDKGS